MPYDYSDIYPTPPDAQQENTPLGSDITPGDDIYDQIARKTYEMKLSQARGAIYAAQDSDPDQYAKAVQFGRDMGLHPDTVQNSIQELERQQALKQKQDVVSSSPNLRGWVSDSTRAKVAQDDLDHLSNVEKALSGEAQGIEFVKTAGKVVERAIPNIAYFTNQALGLTAGAIDSGARGMETLTGLPRGRFFEGARDWFLNQSRWIKSNILDDPALNLPPELKGRVWDNPTLLASPSWWLFQGGEAASSMVPVVMATMASGGTAAGALVGSMMEGAELYDQLLQDGVDQNVAASAAMAYGATVAGLEKFGLNAIFAKKTARTFVGKLAKMGAAGAKEGFSEWLEEPAQNFWESIAKGHNPEQLVNNVIEGAKNIDVFFGSALVGSALSFGHINHEATIAQNADQEAKVLDDLSKGMASSLLAQRDPILYQEAVAALKEGGKIQNVYVPAARVFDLFPDPPQRQTVLEALGVAEQFLEAMGSGGDLVIPVENYAKAIAQDPQLAATLVNDRRVTTDGMTRTEAKDWFESQADLMRRAIDVATEAREREDVFDQQGKEIYDAIKAAGKRALAATGMDQALAARNADATALSMSAAFTTLARRSDGRYLPMDLFRAAGFGPVEITGSPDVMTGGEAGGLAQALAQNSNQKNKYVYRNYDYGKGTPFSEYGHAMWADDQKSVAHYGNRAWRADASNLPDVEDLREIIEKTFMEDFENGILPPALEDIGPEILDDLNPDSIVEHAGVWDNPDFVQWFGENVAVKNDIMGVKTSDGAITFEEFPYESVAHQDEVYQSGLRDQILGLFRPLEDGRYPVIDLFSGANVSTLLHETGHVYAEMIRALGTMQNAAPDHAQLWQDMKEAFAIQGDGAIEKAVHERFAREMEAYFREGKAPSVKLSGVFERFKAWLMAIYRSLTQMGVKPSKEVKSLFDRLFATDGEISEAEAYYQAQKPFFDTASNIDQKALADLAAKRTKAQDESRQTRAAKLTKAYIEASGGKKGIRAQVEATINENPVYAAAKEAVNDGCLDLEALYDLVGSGLGKQLIKRFPGIAKYEGVIAPDLRAAKHGFKNAVAMARAIIDAPKRGEAVKAGIAERLDSIAKQIADGIKEDTDFPGDIDYHNEARLAVLLAEAQLASSQARSPLANRRTSPSLVREVARELLRQRTVSDATSYLKYAHQERKASKKAWQAKERGNVADMAEYKRQEMLNHALFLESLAIREQVQKIERRVKAAAGQKSMSPDAHDLTRMLGIKFGLIDYAGMSRERAWEAYTADLNRLQKPVPDLASWADSMRDEGYTIAFDPVLYAYGPMDYRKMSWGQFQEVAEAVSTIRRIDRQERTFAFEGKRISMELMVQKLSEVVAGREPVKNSDFRKFPVRDALRTAHTWHAKMEFLLQQLDGWKWGGPWWTAMFKPIADAEDARTRKLVGVRNEMRRLMQKYYPTAKARYNLFNKRHYVAEFNDSLTEAQLQSIALNLGNAVNKARILEGYGLTQEQLQSIIDNRLEKKHFDFAQEVWDYLDTFRPEAFALHRRMTGVEPQRVLAEPLPTRFGEYRGGYYPIKYDADLSYRAFQRESADFSKSVFGGQNFGQAMTRKGHLEERAKSGGGQKLALDLSVMTDHLFNVVHDITHREAVVEIGKLLRNKEVQALIEQHLGREGLRQFLPWLQSVANERQEPTGRFWRAAGWARHGATMMQMGFKATTILTQPLGILQTIDVIGAQHTAIGVGHVYKGLPSAVEEIFTKSTFMKNRILNVDRDAREAVKNLSLRGTMSQQVQRFAYYGIGFVQMGVDLPTWWGAYQKGLAENGGDESKAVAYADSVVRMSAGSGSMKDLARVQRGDDLTKLFTMFYSYFNTIYNLAYRRVGMTRGWGDVPALAGSALLLWILPTILQELIAGRGPDKDEDWARWAIPLVAQTPFQTIVGVRDVANGVLGEFGYQMSPAELTPESVIRWSKAVSKAIEKDKPEKLVTPTLDLIGYMAHLPMKQLEITAGGVYDFMSGNPDAQLRDLLFTKPKDRRNK